MTKLLKTKNRKLCLCNFCDCKEGWKRKCKAAYRCAVRGFHQRLSSKEAVKEEEKNQNGDRFLKKRAAETCAIIMIGNGRWAKQRNLPRKYGHREGAKTVRKIVEYCNKIGLQYLTVYAFSTENWKRPKDEVDSIMELLEQYIDEAFAHRKKTG